MKSNRPEDFETTIRELLRMNYYLESRAIAKLGITVGQCHLLFLVKEHDSLTMGELSTMIGVTTGATTGFISRLMGRRLVKRYHDAQDRRRVRVKLTAHGEKVMTEILKTKRQRLAGVLAVISRKEQRDFQGILGKIHGYLRQAVRRWEKK